MGEYCKAYPLGALRVFPGWREPGEVAGTDTSIVFVQQDYSVTAGVFLSEQVVFDAVTPAWIEFCHVQLGFVPSEVTQHDSDLPTPGS